MAIERIPQGIAYLAVFKAYLSSDHASEATGKTIAITICKNDATSFSNPAAGATNATEKASGWYHVALGASDTNVLGPLAIRGAAATIDDVAILLDVVSANIYFAGAAIARGTVTTGASATSVPTSALLIANVVASGVVADQFKGRVVLFDGNTTTAGLRGASSAITAGTASNTPTLTVDPALPATPASGDIFSVI